MKIQLTEEDLRKGGHSGTFCPFHHAIRRACPKMPEFSVGGSIIVVDLPETDEENPLLYLYLPTKMVNWISKWDRDYIYDGELPPLISVDLPLERYCS